MRRIAIAIMGFAVLALSALAAAPANGQGGDAQVRVAHFSPNAPAVDIYVNDDKTLSDVTYKTVSDYLSVPAGDYNFKVVPAGSPIGDAVIDADATLAAGSASTVAAVGLLDSIQAQVYEDDLAAPASGQAKVRVIHAAVDVPAVDVAVANGPTLFSDVSFPNATDYAGVDAGSYDIEVKAAGSEDVLLTADGLGLDAGTIYSVAAIGDLNQNNVELLPIVDASGASHSPSGGVATGGGGTAAGAAPVTLAVLAGIGVLGLAFVAARRSLA